MCHRSRSSPRSTPAGQVAFYATLVRVKATEGIFLATGARIEKVAAVADAVPGGGTLSEFASIRSRR